MEGTLNKAERIDYRKDVQRIKLEPIKRKLRPQPCWCCGQNMTTHKSYGYVVCEKCDNEHFDPEAMEEVVIESMMQGRLVSLAELKVRPLEGDAIEGWGR